MATEAPNTVDGGLPLDDLIKCSVALSVALGRQVWVWHPRGRWVVNTGRRPGRARHVALVIGQTVLDKEK